MKVLEVGKLYAPWLGGVESIVQQIAEGLKEDLQMEVLCCNSKGKTKTDQVNEIKVTRANSLGVVWGMPLSFNFINLFRKKIKETDVVDFHHPFPLGDLAMLFFTPEKLVVHYHSDIVRQKILSFFFKPLIFHTLRKADKIIVSNPNLIETSPYLKKFEEKCEVIPFGVNLKELNNYADQKKVEEIKNQHEKFVLFAGRLNYYKGLQCLVKAMKEVNADLVVIGEGEQEEKLKRIASEIGIEEKITFLSFQSKEKLINFYRAAEVFVLPSIFRSEAFGIVLIEAMSQETPVVSTELGTGTSWVNQDGETGFVVSPEDEQQLAEVINKIVENDSLKEELGKKAGRRVEEKFTEERMMRKTRQVYQDLTRERE